MTSAKPITMPDDVELAPESAAQNADPRRGRFITFEGGEGAGKSTQVQSLAARLRSIGLEVVVSREPGGSVGAEAIRHVLLSGAAKPLGPHAEAMLFAAARADHVRQTIAPALARGAWVISDRFADSTRIYQGVLGNVDKRLIERLEAVTIGDTKPDLTIILDVPATVGQERVAKRRGNAAPDRFESEAFDFHKKLREAYLELAEREPSRCVPVDASGDPQSVASAVWGVVEARLHPGEPQPAAEGEGA